MNGQNYPQVSFSAKAGLLTLRHIGKLPFKTAKSGEARLCLLSFPMTGFRRRTAASALTATVIQKAAAFSGYYPHSLVYQRA